MIPCDSQMLVNFPILCFDTSYKVWHRSKHVRAFNLVLLQYLKSEISAQSRKNQLSRKYGFYVLACDSKHIVSIEV